MKKTLGGSVRRGLSSLLSLASLSSRPLSPPLSSWPLSRARSRIGIFFALLFFVSAAGCRRDLSSRNRESHVPDATLTVSAAVSLKEAMGDVARVFEAAHPGVHVSLNLGASGDLARQAEAGAPVDVIATADEVTLDRLADRGLLAAGSRRDLAGNQLVLVARAGALPDLRAATLASDARVARVSLGHPASVPAGRYAETWLRALGVWAALAPKLVYAGNVRQVLDYVARGEADAGIVYATDASTVPGLTIADRAPTDLWDASRPVSRDASRDAGRGAVAIRYPIAAVAASPRLDLARAFVDAATGPAGRAALAAHGFLPL